jgi:hypothetical protein
MAAVSTAISTSQYCNVLMAVQKIINDAHVYVRGHAVAQLVEALGYIPEGRGFDSRWCHWNFSLM